MLSALLLTLEGGSCDLSIRSRNNHRKFRTNVSGRDQRSSFTFPASAQCSGDTDYSPDLQRRSRNHVYPRVDQDYERSCPSTGTAVRHQFQCRYSGRRESTRFYVLYWDYERLIEVCSCRNALPPGAG